MATKKGSSGIVETVLLVVKLFNDTVSISQVIGRELRRAAKSIFALIILGAVFAILLTSTWFGLLWLLFLYLISVHWTMAGALGIIIGLNVLLLTLVGFKMCKIKRKISISCGPSKSWR